MTFAVITEEIQDLGGRTNIMDEQAGITTRGKKNDAYKQEREVDEAVDAATQYDYETGGQKIPQTRQ